VIMQSKIMDALESRVLTLGPAPATGRYRHLRLTRDADGIAWLLFDREGSSANTLCAEVMEELDQVLTALESERASGLVIRSAKSSGFIAGADVNEFRGAHDPAVVEAAIARANAVIGARGGFLQPAARMTFFIAKGPRSDHWSVTASCAAIEGESYRLKEAHDRTEQRARQSRGAKS